MGPPLDSLLDLPAHKLLVCLSGVLILKSNMLTVIFCLCTIIVTLVACCVILSHVLYSQTANPPLSPPLWFPPLVLGIEKVCSHPRLSPMDNNPYKIGSGFPSP